MTPISRVVAGPVDALAHTPLTISWTPAISPAGVDAVDNVSIGTETAHNSLEKRQVVLTRALQATWYFRCPNSGPESRVFKWKGTVHLSDRQIVLYTIYNIDKFIDLKLEGHNFHAFFVHGVCIPRGTKSCFYRFQGKTTGWLDGYGIHMNQIIHSLDTNENPLVQEECIDTGHGQTCPANPEHTMATCTVDSVTVINIDVPESELDDAKAVVEV